MSSNVYIDSNLKYRLIIMMSVHTEGIDFLQIKSTIDTSNRLTEEK